MHNNFFFCFFSMDITEEIYNWDSNKTSTIHLNPYFFPWFFFPDECIIVFHSLKYYTVKKTKTIHIIFFYSPVTVGEQGQQPGSKRWNICQNTLWSWQKILQCLHFLLLRTALIRYSSAWHEFLNTAYPKS